jgi:hypothetical protein
MWALETDRVRSENWDPALWSIGAVLGAAIVYLACLSRSLACRNRAERNLQKRIGAYE